MKRYLLSIFIKYFLIAFILAFLMPLFGNYSVTAAFILAIPITLIQFILGDILVLPRLGNSSSSIGGAILTALFIWQSDLVFPSLTLEWPGILLSSLMVGISEWFFHLWLVGTQEIVKLPSPLKWR